MTTFNLTRAAHSDFDTANTHIMKGHGFCSCDDGKMARNIPDGTMTRAIAMLCQKRPEPGIPKLFNYLSLGKEGGVYLSYDFVIADVEDGGSWVRKEIRADELTDPDGKSGRRPEIEKLINSAANTFSWDSSSGAERERSDACYDTLFPVYIVNDMAIAVELGIAPNGTNFVKRILEPDDPEYITVMELEGYALAGTGLGGNHTPIEAVEEFESNLLRKSTSEKA